MRTYFPPQLLNPAQQTGRWAVRDIDDDQILYTTNLGSYLRCRVTGSHQLILTVANHHSDLGPGQVYALRVDSNLWRRFPARQETEEGAWVGDKYFRALLQKAVKRVYPLGEQLPGTR